MTTKLAITGGAGFLGYHLCNQLSDKFEQILILDITPINPEEYPPNIRYFNADVRNIDQLNEIFKEVNSVIHAAAALPLWKKEEIFDINVNGTRNVLEAAKNNNIKRVVYISSTAVYGIPEKHPIYEEDALIGVGPYGESKIEAEKICKEYRKEGMCIPILRPKTFIGTARLGVFQILYDWIESGKKIPIIGNGKNRYQLLEVEDLISAIYLLLTASWKKANDTFNVGAEDFETVQEDLNDLCRFAGTGARIMFTPVWLAKALLALFEKMKLSPLYKWVYGTANTDSYVSIERIKNVFGWLPKYSNVQALIRSYEWYLAHKDELLETGTTHRVVWRQGVLKVLKRFL